MRSRAALVTSAVSVVVVVVADHPSMIGPVIVLWFMAVAPGSAFARVVPLMERDGAAAWAIAIATSFAIDVLVTETMVYAHIWTASRSLMVLAGVVLALLLAETLGREKPLEQPIDTDG